MASSVKENHHLILFIASLGYALTMIDTNIVGVVLPTISKGFEASFAKMEWVIGAYLLLFSSLLIPAGLIADKFGHRRVFLCGISLFAMASLGCGFAASLVFLNFARALQGIGSAFLLAPAIAIIGHTIMEAPSRSRIWAIWGGIMGLTVVLSPVAGGMISTFWGWRWAFYINIPICIILGIAVYVFISESYNLKTVKPDIQGVILFTAGMFMFLWAFILASVYGWFSNSVIIRITAAIALFLCFVFLENCKKNPMINIRLFRNMSFIGSILAMFAYAGTAQVMTSLLPSLFQNVDSRTSLVAGAEMLPFAIAMLVFPTIASWMGKFISARVLLACGLIIVGIGNLIAAKGIITHQEWISMAGMTFLGCGGGILNGETQKAILHTVPYEHAGMASGISMTTRFAGVLFGFSILGSVWVNSTRKSLSIILNQHAIQVKDGFIKVVISGNYPKAISLYPKQQSDMLLALIRQSYGKGFSIMLCCAAFFAFLSAIVVIFTMTSHSIKLTNPKSNREKSHDRIHSEN